MGVKDAVDKWQQWKIGAAEVEKWRHSFGIDQWTRNIKIEYNNNSGFAPKTPNASILAPTCNLRLTSVIDFIQIAF